MRCLPALLLVLLFSSLGALLPGRVRAAEIGPACGAWSLCPTDLHLTGRILPGDAARLQRLLLAIPVRRLALSSPGGSLQEGLAIGRLLRQRQVSTWVRKGEVCGSACAYAFLGGVGRVLSEGSHLVVHQFSRCLGDCPSVSAAEATRIAQETQALILDYVLEMGVDPRILVLAAAAPPETGLILTEAQARSWAVTAAEPQLMVASPVTAAPSDQGLRVAAARVGITRQRNGAGEILRVVRD